MKTVVFKSKNPAYTYQPTESEVIRFYSDQSESFKAVEEEEDDIPEQD